MRRANAHNRARFILLSTLAVALPFQAFCAKPHHKREAREEILALEQQWKLAQIADDIPAMDKLLSDDYLGITAGGDAVTKTQQLDRMRSRAISITSMELGDIKVKLVGHVAIVNSLARVHGTSENQPLDGSYRYTRVYQHLPSGLWKITNFEITRIHDHHGKDASSD